MRRLLMAARAALFIAMPTMAAAQSVAAVSLTDLNPAAWDASGHVSWLTVDKTGIAPEWNRWYDVATFGGSLGRFFGPHVKVELDAATSTAAEVYVERRVAVPGQTFPIYFSQPQRFRTTTLSGGATYQFLNNRWVHPFVGAGIEASRETRTVEEVLYPVAPPGTVALEPPGTTSTWRSRPFADVGFKFFVSERVFVRSDVRTTFDRDGVSHVSWRSGVGFDF
jgi:hypothetical protein